MNKIAKLMCLVAVFALVGTSCKKKEETTTVNITMPELSVEDEDGAKSYLVGNRVEWDASDRFVIFNVEADNSDFESGEYRVQGGTGNKITVAPVGEGVDPYRHGAFYAFYPYGDETGGWQYAATPDAGHVTATFLLPPVQQYRKVGSNTAIPMNSFAMAAKDTQASYLGDVRFNMQAICGVLHLRYWTKVAGKRVDHIRVYDKTFNVSGLVEMYIDKINPTELMEYLNNYNTSDYYLNQLANYKQEIGYYIPAPEENPSLSQIVTLNCITPDSPNGVLLSTDRNHPTDFYLGLRPLAAFGGMKITVYFTDNTYAVAYNNETNNKIKPNVMKDMAVREVYNFANL
jgi:hypothetical protein